MAEQAKTFLQMLDTEKPNILAMIPSLNEWMTAERWWATAYEVAKSPALTKVAQSNPTSLINALKKIASWGLELGTDECFINVYGDEATAQTMYKGLIRRAVEGGAIVHAVADIIKEGDDVQIVSSTRGRELVHRPAFGVDGGKRKIIGAYCLMTLPNGMTDYEIFELSDIEAVKAAALRMSERKKPGAGLSPAWRFFEGEQCKKSVINRGLKRFKGRRDTEAGKLYNKMQAETDPFDIDKVRAAEKANADVQTPEQPGRKVEPEVEHPDNTANEPISEDEQLQLLEVGRGKGLKTPTSLLKFINMQCNIAVEDLDSLKKGQLTAVMEKMAS